MPFPIDKKLVLAVSSSALFDLSDSDLVYREQGVEPYREYQREHENDILGVGVAYPFIRRFLSLNKTFPDEQPVEVVLLSHNDFDTGLRVFNSIEDNGLNITRAAFLGSDSPFRYITAFNVSLFLSANPVDVSAAIKAGYPAGTVLDTKFTDDSDDHELRVAFDFDGVIVDDEAETTYAENEDVDEFQSAESKKAAVPLEPGPLNDFFRKLSQLQKLDRKRISDNPGSSVALHISIITARNAPAHRRVVTTLRDWDVIVDNSFFLGGIEKNNVLNVLNPHIFFDDQMTHLKSSAEITPSVHVPFGIRNNQP
ncbi:MAG: 5'-nucleotidase [Chloroflexi bacterium]|nr:5'-nucleotidase [Chloroflexota bacterium]